jgi:hypothetical protein
MIVDVTVDDVPLKDLKSYRVSSPLFNLTLPEIMFSITTTTNYPSGI